MPITKKEKHDGQKKQYLVGLVARGFQETDKTQDNSPSAAKESFKFSMDVVANNKFKLTSIDIRAAFLRAEMLDRKILLWPPEN